MISTPFEYSRATSLDDALAKLGATKGEGKFIAGGHSLVPLMKLRLSEPKILIDIARIPGLSGIRERTARSRSARARSITTWPRPRCCSARVRRYPIARPRSAIRRFAIAERSAAASRMRIRPPTTRP